MAGNLAGEFVSIGYSVALVDADPQHSLAAWAAQGNGLLKSCVRVIRNGDPAELKSRTREFEKTADIVIVDTPPGMPETTAQALLLADLALLPCGPSPLDLFALKDALSLALEARAVRRSKKPRIRFVPSRVLTNTNLGKSLNSSLEKMGKKVLPPISQRVAVAQAVAEGLTVVEYAPNSPSHEEFQKLAKAVKKILNKTK